MEIVAPERYRDFVCIADKCRHSCCIGWEIDIDAQSLTRYDQLSGEMGHRLRSSIQRTGDTACFRLQGTEERCPFLNPQGLCDLILELGEDSLCQICTDHPRFRHFYSHRTEIGLGLCCEAAGRLLLSDEDPMRLTVLETDGISQQPDPEEAGLLALRTRLFAMVQDRSLPIADRMEKLLPAAGIDWADWLAFLLTLERLDERWTQLLTSLQSAPVLPGPENLDCELEQLICYLLYRHLPGALEDGDPDGRIRFAALMWRLIVRLCAQHQAEHGSVTLEDLVEYARLFSSEIEYSSENTDAILDHLFDTMA